MGRKRLIVRTEAIRNVPGVKHEEDVMIVKQVDGNWAIDQYGDGEGFWNLTMAELIELKVEVENIMINEDVQEVTDGDE